MKKFRKIIYLFLCISLFVVFATGCGKAKEYEKKIVGEWKLQNGLVNEVTVLTFNSDMTCKEVLIDTEYGDVPTFVGTYEFDKKGILYMTPNKGNKIRMCSISFEGNDTMKIAAFAIDDLEYKRQK